MDRERTARERGCFRGCCCGSAVGGGSAGGSGGGGGGWALHARRGNGATSDVDNGGPGFWASGGGDDVGSGACVANAGLAASLMLAQTFTITRAVIVVFVVGGREREPRLPISRQTRLYLALGDMYTRRRSAGI